jgi:hypothetical protein
VSVHFLLHNVVKKYCSALASLVRDSHHSIERFEEQGLYLKINFLLSLIDLNVRFSASKVYLNFHDPPLRSLLPSIVGSHYLVMSTEVSFIEEIITIIK